MPKPNVVRRLNNSAWGRAIPAFMTDGSGFTKSFFGSKGAKDEGSVFAVLNYLN
jgi:hypothetical protein